MADHPEDDTEAISTLLPRLFGALQRRMARNLADDGLTFPQYFTLYMLAQAGGSCRMGSLANSTMQSAAAMTGIVDRLLERGLVQRERHPRDRRSVVVQLTAQGQALLARAQEKRAHWERLLLQSLSPDERHCMRALLEKMVELLDTGTDL